MKVEGYKLELSQGNRKMSPKIDQTRVLELSRPRTESSP